MKNSYNHKDFIMDRIYETLSHKYNYHKKGKRKYLRNIRKQMVEAIKDIDEIIKKFNTIKE